MLDLRSDTFDMHPAHKRRAEGGAALDAPMGEQGRAPEDAKARPLVSVVIPTFNRAGLLARALHSVRQQTYPNLEIIVVDDASRDDTATVVEKIGDPRVRYLRHAKNRGGSAARNTGVRAACGDFIAFLDDDDEWDPRKTEEQLRVLDNCDAVLCTSNTPAGGAGRYDGKYNVDLDDLRRGYFTSGGTGVLMTKAHVLKEISFDESLPRYQDWDIFIRIAQKYPIGYLNRSFVKYNAGSHERITNKIASMPARDLERQLQMVRKHKAFFGEKWFRRHMAKGLLYGIKHRGDRVAHLRYVARHYGAANVGWALLHRAIQKTTERRRARGTAAARHD